MYYLLLRAINNLHLRAEVTDTTIPLGYLWWQVRMQHSHLFLRYCCVFVLTVSKEMFLNPTSLSEVGLLH